jgi:hypothetical protein
MIKLKRNTPKKESKIPNYMKNEIAKRATEMKVNSENSITGQNVYQEIINKYGFDIPTSLHSQKE